MALDQVLDLRSTEDGCTTVDIDPATGYSYTIPDDVNWVRLRTINADVACRLDVSASPADPKSVVTPDDRTLTHGSITGGDTAWAVGNFLVGGTSGAEGVIVEIVDGTHVRVTITNGIEFVAETVVEHTAEGGASATGDSAAVSEVVTPPHDGVARNTSDQRETRLHGGRPGETLLFRPFGIPASDSATITLTPGR